MPKEQTIGLQELIESDPGAFQQSMFVVLFDIFAQNVHENARAHGWWDEPRNAGEAIALVHSELSEMLEAMRHGNPPDQHLPEFDSATVEAADVIIRLMDWCTGKGLPLAQAIVAKVQYNQTREYKHGKEF